MVKKIITKLLKSYYKNDITFKPFKGTGSKLYYEQSQHLMFTFKKSIVYEDVVQDKVKRYVHKSDLVFDIGGNIGQYALLFSELVGSKGKVVSLEPDHKNFSFLQFNVNINKLNNVICLKKGMSDTIETINFYRDTETGGRMGSFKKSFVGNNFKGETEQVETSTLDFLIDTFGIPDFVKIDVEGFEENVIKGLSKSLEKTTFLVEVRKETKEKVFSYFKDRGYNCLYIDKRNDVVIDSAEMIPDFADLIFKKG